MLARSFYMAGALVLVAAVGCAGHEGPSTEEIALRPAAPEKKAASEKGPARKAEDFEAHLKPFLERHCVACHGPEVKRRGLRLDTLPRKFGDKDVAATWIDINRVSRGEMPPRTKPRPARKDADVVLGGLRQQLHDASLARQQRDGRVVLRRLNRTEYETTLRDLLGTPVEVKALLPDDNTAAGFDNVSAVLDVSATHLLRYQQAAEKALRAVIPNRPQAALKERRTGRQVTKQMIHFASILGKSARLDGDALILHTRTYGHIPCATAPAPVAGRYRVRLSARAVGTAGKPLPVLWSCRDMYGREDNDVRAVLDAPAGKGAILEAEVELKPRKVIVVSGWSLPSERDFPRLRKKGKIEYKGPGLAVNWIEIEGPLGAWPPPGYQRLFAGVPLKPRSVAKAEAEGRPLPPQPAKRPAGWWIYDPLVPAPAKPRADAERLMRSFLPQAFRRPVRKEVQDYYVKVVHAALDKGLSFADAMLLGYKTALCSPHFLFLIEPMDEKRGAKRTILDNHAVASRLAYFLWSSLPDSELLQLAGKGELTKPAVLRAQTERLLKDARASRFTANFAGQWLDLRNINATSPDPQIYGEFDDFLFWSMPRETELFFEDVLKNDRSLIDFVHSDWSFLNQRLAQHYGIAGVIGGELPELPCGRQISW